MVEHSVIRRKQKCLGASCEGTAVALVGLWTGKGDRGRVGPLPGPGEAELGVVGRAGQRCPVLALSSLPTGPSLIPLGMKIRVSNIGLIL